LRRNHKIVYLSIIAAFLIYKILILTVKGPLFLPDTPHYVEYASGIMNGSLISPDAIRTPVYPLLIAIVRNFTLVVLAQILLGLAAIFLLYRVLVGAGFEKLALPVVTLTYISPLSFADLKIIPDSLTFFLLCCFMYLVSIASKQNQGSKLPCPTVFGSKLPCSLLVLITILLILIRPQYSVVIICAGILLILIKEKFTGVLLVSLTAAVVAGYSLVNYSYNNYFGMTSLLSFNLVNHTGYYIEKARDLNPKLVDVYLDCRNKRMQSHLGRQEFTLGDCRDSIRKELGIGNIELAKELDRINFFLISRYPLNYLGTLYYPLSDLFTYEDSFYNLKIGMPMRFINLFTNLCFAAGFLLMFAQTRDRNFVVRIFLAVFLSNLLASVLLDSGETFRHILPTVFIPYFFLMNYKRQNHARP
jgi:hypothetical protein